MGDWLGTGNISNRMRRFEAFTTARAKVRKLGIKSQTEWFKYCKSGELPLTIPSNPHRTYADSGWTGFGDWLGTETSSTRVRKYRPFEQARAFVRDLKLKSTTEWYAYRKSGKRPSDIPANPHTTYATDGWVGMGDWLGNGKAPRLRKYRAFKDARAFVHGLGLKSSKEWTSFCLSGSKPWDIPAKPAQAYVDSGWISYGDWLGTNTTSTRNRVYQSFKVARAFARNLGLKSQADWIAYCKSGKRPSDIPYSPQEVYADHGWLGLGDWLGTGVAPRLRQYRPFQNARIFVRGLGLKSWAEWKAYCGSDKKPADIPSRPDKVFAGDGWAGGGDWLGYAR